MSVRISIKVHPRAKHTRLAGKIGEAYKMDVASAPVSGRANKACIDYLAEVLHVPKSTVRIISGASARMKVFEIDGVKEEAVKGLLG